ncbi:hypothetical protein HanRHA438_Chr01g0025811 [Helianthus annuus]|nr:hypothetical protein HanRHA438_Chr01g0025811 [Helianthus annuus]
MKKSGTRCLYQEISPEHSFLYDPNSESIQTRKLLNPDGVPPFKYTRTLPVSCVAKFVEYIV